MELRGVGCDLRHLEHVPGNGQHDSVSDYFGFRIVLIAIPVLLLARRSGFTLLWVWYISVAAVFIQLAMNLLLLRREFRDGSPSARERALHPHRTKPLCSSPRPERLSHAIPALQLPPHIPMEAYEPVGTERRDIKGRAAVVQRVIDGVVQNPSVTLTVNTLQQWLGVPDEAAERILDRLASSGLVREVQKGVWARGTGLVLSGNGINSQFPPPNYQKTRKTDSWRPDKTASMVEPIEMVEPLE